VSWQHSWLNDGFASWMTGLTLERLLDNGQWWEPWKRLQKESALSSQDHVVFKTDTSIVAALFQNRSTYHKASMVIHQLRYVLGDSALFAGVYNFITDPTLAYGFASTQTIKNHLEAACNCNLTTYFDQWVYNSGHPEYNINWSPKTQGVSLFIEDQSPLAPAGGFDIDLPFRVYAANGDSVDLRITERGTTIYAHRDLPFVPVRVVFDPDIQTLAQARSLERASETLQIQHISASTGARVFLPASWEGQLATLELYDLLGRRLFVQEAASPIFSLDLPYYLLGGSLSGIVHARHPDGRVAVGRFFDMRSR
jgi:aminopeptidase N